MLDTPDKAADALREEARSATTEHLRVLLLNTRRRLLKVVDVVTGTLDTLLVHPRKAVKRAIAANVAAIKTHWVHVLSFGQSVPDCGYFFSQAGSGFEAPAKAGGGFAHYGVVQTAS